MNWGQNEKKSGSSQSLFRPKEGRATRAASSKVSKAKRDERARVGPESTQHNGESSSNDESDVLHRGIHGGDPPGRFLDALFPSVGPEPLRAAQPHSAAAVPGGRPLRAAQLHLR